MLNFNNQDHKLKYLFVAEFVDGTFFNQTPDDQSTLVEKRNCYYDVLQTGKTIRRFSLVGQGDAKGNTITVDLGSGIFYVNGLPVLVESEKLPTLPDKFTLIWYHQVTRDTNITLDTKTNQILKSEDMPEFREYFIGWQCLINKRNYQIKMAVS